MNKIYCYLHPEAHLIHDYDSGDIKCPLCGLVVVDRVIDIFIDSRNYSHDDQRVVRSCVGGPENYLLHSCSNLSTVIKPRQEIKLTKAKITEGLQLKYGNSHLFNSSDRYLLCGLEEITIMGDRINLPKIVIDRAQFLLKTLNDENMLKGRSNYAKASACLYIACRQENSPRSYKEICAISNSSKKEIGRCFKLIIRALNTPVKAVSSVDFILRFCGNLNLPYTVNRIALNISMKISKLNQMDGRSPVSIAAAAIYLASKITNNERSEEHICQICGISATTLTTMNKILIKYENEIVPKKCIDQHCTS